MLVATLLCTATAVILTGYVLFGDATTRSDAPILDWVASQRGDTRTTIATVITHLGGSIAMWVLVFLVCGWCYWQRRHRELFAIACTGVGAALTVPGLKALFDRDRPPVADRLITVRDAAYPSGHSLGSVAVIGIVITVLVVSGGQRRRIAVTAATVSLGFVIAVGFSRIYLGVHWPTDVFAGWAIGALWALAGLALYHRIGCSDSSGKRAARHAATPPSRR